MFTGMIAEKELSPGELAEVQGGAPLLFALTTAEVLATAATATLAFGVAALAGYALNSKDSEGDDSSEGGCQASGQNTDPGGQS